MRLSIVKIYHQYIYLDEEKKVIYMLYASDILAVRYCNGNFFLGMLQQKVVQIKSRTWASYTRTHKKREKEQAERPLSNILFRNYIQQKKREEKK